MDEPLGGLRALVVDLCLAASWRETARLIDRYPVLLTDETEALLAALIDADPDEGRRRILADHRELLRGVREAGMDRTLLRFAVTKTDAGIEEDMGHVATLVTEFTNAPRAQSLRLLEEYPLLLHPAVPDIIGPLAEAADADGDPFAEGVRRVGRLLDRAREVGALRALAELSVADYLASDDDRLRDLIVSWPELRDPVAGQIMAETARLARGREREEIEARSAVWRRFTAGHDENGLLDLRSWEALTDDSHLALVGRYLAASPSDLSAILREHPELGEGRSMTFAYLERIRRAMAEDDRPSAVRFAFRMVVASSVWAGMDPPEIPADVEREVTEILTAFLTVDDAGAFRGLIDAYRVVLVSPLAVSVLTVAGLVPDERRARLLEGCLRRGVAETFADSGPEADGSRSPDTLHRLATEFSAAYQRTRRPADRVTAAVLAEATALLLADGSEEQAAAFGYAGEIRLLASFHTGAPHDLDTAIRHFTVALAHESGTGRRNPDRINAASAFRERATRDGTVEDLTRAVELTEQTLADDPPEPGLAAQAALLVVLALKERGEALRSVGDLDRALESVERVPSDQRQWLRREVLQARRDVTGDHSRLLALLRDDARQAPGAFDARFALGEALVQAGLNQVLFATGSADDLLDASATGGADGLRDEAVSELRTALGLASSEEEALAVMVRLTELRQQLVLTSRSSLLDMVESAEETLRLARRSESPWLSYTLVLVGRALRLRAHLNGDPAELRRAMDTLDAAAELEPPEDVARLHLRELVAALRLVFELTGDRDALDRAVELTESALSPRGAFELNELALLHAERFHVTGSAADIDRAIDAAQRALDLLTPGSWDWRCVAMSLGNRLMTRAGMYQNRADADLGVEILRQVVLARPDERLVDTQARALTNLGSALHNRHRLSGGDADLEESVRILGQACDLTDPASPRRARRLFNHANVLVELARHDDDPQILDTAVSLYREAIDLVDNDAFRDLYKVGLLQALRHRAVDRDQFVALATEILDTAEAPRQVIHAADLLGSAHAARGDWAAATAAYGRGLEKLAVAVRGEPLRSHREGWLRTGAGLPVRAALALTHLGRPGEAAEVLERGRVILLDRALDRATADLVRLRSDGHDDLADQWEALDRTMAALEATEQRAEEAAQAWADVSARMTEALAAQSELLDTIRGLPGHAGFLHAGTALPAAAADPGRPLVYLASARDTGFALIVRGPDDVTAVWLPGLAEDHLTDELARFEQAQSFDALVSRLSDAVFRPLANTLAERVTLVPLGVLGQLPLHAAVPDVTVAYAPSARMLARARADDDRTALRDVLAVADPSGTSLAPLPAARLEAEVVASVFDDHKPLLIGQAATRTAVRSQASAADVLHIAGHGHASAHSPLDSGLVMADGEILTARDLAEDGLGARLVILSACESGVAGTELPDEVIGLPTGLLHAGASAVLATMWRIPDTDALVFAVAFYDAWRRRNLDPPDACAAAQKWLRTTTDGEKTRYFSTLMEDPAAWLPRPVAERCWEHLILNDPDARTHADPALWAAFAYYGA